MTKVNTFFVVTVCACAILTSPVLGSYMTYNGMGLKSKVRIHASGLLADGLKTNVGQLKVTYENTDILAYCVDLNHYAKSAFVTEQDMNCIHNGDLVAWLYDTYAESVTSGIEAAGLNAAIWEVVYETDAAFDAGTGYFWISENQDALQYANDLLASLDSIPSSYIPSNGMTVLHSDLAQDVVVPEPTCLGLLGAGATILIGKRRGRIR